MPLPTEILETLPEEYRENETLNRFNDVSDLAKSYLEARSTLGSSIRIPGPDAGEEDKSAFYQKLVDSAPNLMLKPDFSDPEQASEYYKLAGRPDEPTKYTRPEEVKLDESVENELRHVLFEAGLTDNQFQKVLKSFSTKEQERIEAITQQTEEQQAELKNKWGMTVEERINAAKKINDEFYPGRDFGSVTPKEIESLYAIHEATTGKGPQAPSQEGNSAGMTPDEAKERAAEIMRRVHDPKSELSHSEKMQLIQKRMDLLTKYTGMDGSIDSLRH